MTTRQPTPGMHENFAIEVEAPGTATDTAQLIEALESAGAGMANICFNLSQDATLPASVRQSMKTGQMQWDAALWALRAARAEETPPPQSRLEGDEIAKLTADRNLYKGKYRSIVALMDDTRQKVQEIVDHIEDEGDRTYFGSSNHADWLRDLVDDMDGWSFDAMLPKGDINKMERDPYADCRQLRWALKLAIEHIEHMAAFIGPLKAGYSFESLGEDMPEIKAALSPTKSEQRS